jgi:hypothetical protein
MLILTNYKLEKTQKSEFPYVINCNPTPVCPFCHGKMKHFEWRRRTTINPSSGKKEYIMIERHLCLNKNCHKIHHLLPDFLIPYKRHLSETIEQFITTGQQQSVRCTCSTVLKAKKWFALCFVYFLTAIKSRQGRYPLSCDKPIESKADLIAEPGWLKWLVITLGNFGYWPRKLQAN